jgi:LysM repeat protein
MQALRQLGGGVIIAIVSVVLVLGGIFLSLAETLPDQATPTQIPPTLPVSFPTPTFTQTPDLQTTTATATETASPSPTISLVSPTVCTPPTGWIRILSGTGDTVYSLAQRYKTSAEHLNAANCFTSSELAAGSIVYVPPVPTVTIIPCGHPAGWVRTHVVQAGDNLYRIALSYGLSYPQLQRANCMGSSTTIYAGQRLWVPNIPTRTPVPGVTIIPDFPTETPSATNTTIPATSTNTATEPPAIATATSTSIPTAIPTATFTITAFPPEDSPQ